MKSFYLTLAFSIGILSGIAAQSKGPLPAAVVAKKPNYALQQLSDAATDASGMVTLLNMKTNETEKVHRDSVYRLMVYPPMDQAAEPNFPMEVLAFSNVQELWVGMRPFTSLPEAIGGLRNLESLDLSDTKITTLPKSVLTLDHLRNLVLYGTAIPKEEMARLNTMLIDAFPNLLIMSPNYN